jgi:hypothetical protein
MTALMFAHVLGMVVVRRRVLAYGEMEYVGDSAGGA